jgi:DHA3 family macrolide efflux protein-like MFS transporter
MATQFNESENPNWKRSFFPIWGGQAASLLGSQIVQFALIWYLTVLTESATVLATASIFEYLPTVLLGPAIGVLVDRWNRRRIMILADTVAALGTVVLVLLFWSAHIEVWHIYAIIFIRSVAGRFQGPAMTASTSLMVPREQLTRIQGLNQTLNGGLNIIAAPLGALLMELLPIEGVVAVDIVTAAVAIGPLMLMAVPQPEAEPGAESGMQGFWRGAVAGIRYILSWPALAIVVGCAALLNFLIAPTFSLLPLLIKTRFLGGAIELGWIESAFGVGAVIGGILLGIWGGFRRGIHTISASIFGIGLGSMVIGILPATGYAFAVLAMGFVGFMLPFANGTLGALMQTSVDPVMQGRVFSTLNSVSTGMVPVGYALAGPLSDRFGLLVWFVLTGAVFVAVGVVLASLPALRDLGQRAETSAVDEAAPASTH